MYAYTIPFPDIQALIAADILHRTEDGTVLFPFDLMHVGFMLQGQRNPSWEREIPQRGADGPGTHDHHHIAGEHPAGGGVASERKLILTS